MIAVVLKIENLIYAHNQITENWAKADILVNTSVGNMPEATINLDHFFLDMDDQALPNIMELNFKGTYQHLKSLRNL